MLTIVPVFVKFKIMEAQELFDGEGSERNRDVVGRVVAFAGQIAAGENPFANVTGAQNQDPMQTLEEDLDALAEDGVGIPSVSALLESYEIPSIEEK